MEKRVFRKWERTFQTRKNPLELTDSQKIIVRGGDECEGHEYSGRT